MYTYHIYVHIYIHKCNAYIYTSIYNPHIYCISALHVTSKHIWYLEGSRTTASGNIRNSHSPSISQSTPVLIEMTNTLLRIVTDYEQSRHFFSTSLSRATKFKHATPVCPARTPYSRTAQMEHRLQLSVGIHHGASAHGVWVLCSFCKAYLT